MYISQEELKTRLTQLNKDIRLFTYPSYRPVNAIYYRGSFVCSIPKGNVYLHKTEKYTDGRGHAHRSLTGIADMLAEKHIISLSDKRKLYT